MQRKIISYVGIISILAGLTGILAAIIITPDFALKYLSPDHYIKQESYNALKILRLSALGFGCLFFLLGILLIRFQHRISQGFFIERVSRPISLNLKHEVILVIFLTCIGLIMRLYGIGDLPLWTDEAHSQWFAKQTLTDLWTVIPRFEQHPPLYYSILHGWQLIFGDNETGLRSLSVVFGTATIPLVYLLGRIVGGSWTGIATALLLAISPLHLEYSQEARPYAALSFSVAMMLVGLAWLMQHKSVSCNSILSILRGAVSSSKLPKTGNALNSARRAMLAWCAFIIGCTGTLWFHNTSVFIVFAVNFVVFFFYASSLRFNKTFLTNWIIANIVILVLWSPYLPFLWLNVQSISQGFWIKKPTFLSVTHLIGTLFGFRHLTSLKPFAEIGAVAMAAAGLVFMARAKQWNWIIFIVSILSLPLLMQIFASLVFTPILLMRTLIPLTIVYFLTIAVGIGRLPRVTLIIVALIFLGTVSARACMNYYDEHRKEPWDVIAATVAETGRKGDVVLLFINAAKLPFDYYFKRYQTGILTLGLPEDYPARGSAVRPMTEKDLPKLYQIARLYSRIWYITRFENLFGPIGPNLIEDVLQQDRNIIKSENFDPGGIKLRLYE